ncbi:MAG TPA: lipoprotein [Methylibium sp.]|nr:lipoprotein [Methylibium sp.]
MISLHSILGRAIAATAVCVCAAGCGQRGPLYLPAPAAKPAAPASAPASAPRAP